MKPAENNIDRDRSNFFVHAPTTVGEKTFFYVLRAGTFYYEPDYHLYRASFNSFLMMHVVEGNVFISIHHKTLTIHKGQFCLIDCYAPHAYWVKEPTVVSWMHFDGPDARNYFDYIVSRRGNVFSLATADVVERSLKTLITAMERSTALSEPNMNRLVVTILTEFANDQPVSSSHNESHAIDEVLSYISSHFSEKLTVTILAKRAYMSEFHFIRLFNQEVGLTPYAYITHIRVRTAQYLLVNTSLSVSQISTKCGFRSSTVMGTAFKGLVGMSPMAYRRSNKKSPVHKPVQKQVQKTQ